MKYFTYEKKISSQEIDDIMSAAMNGMSYWADDAKIVARNIDESDKNIDVSEAISRGYAIKIHDFQEDKWLYLDRLHFLKGLSMMNHHDFYEYDMYDSEQVIQYALFEKQVYG